MIFCWGVMRGGEGIKSSNVYRLTIRNIFWPLNESVPKNTIELLHRAG